MRSLAALAIVLIGCTPRNPDRREVSAPLAETADTRAPIAIYDGLEALIASGSDKEADRLYAYHRARERPDDGSASYAFARAALAGRVAELRGAAAGGLVGEAESFARKSIERDPNFRNGANRRMLGSLYVMAPSTLLDHGDSEDGLELLEQLVEQDPSSVENRLRLGEAYVHLGDHEPAAEHLCAALQERGKLRADEQRLLDRVVKDAGGIEALACDGAGRNP
jgi:tetratricopeptide (TPR) repeat protein